MRRAFDLEVAISHLQATIKDFSNSMVTMRRGATAAPIRAILAHAMAHPFDELSLCNYF
jgi:hypothetical protein